MEPIFNDEKFRSNKSVINDCQLFIAGTTYFFAHPKNRTLENAYYHFGLMFDSLHYERNEKWRATGVKFGSGGWGVEVGKKRKFKIQIQTQIL